MRPCSSHGLLIKRHLSRGGYISGEDRKLKRYVKNSMTGDDKEMSTFCACFRHLPVGKSLFYFPHNAVWRYFVKKKKEKTTISAILSIQRSLNAHHWLPENHFLSAFYFFWSFHKEESVGIYLFPYSSSTLQWNNEKINNAMHQRQSSKGEHFPVFRRCAVM